MELTIALVFLGSAIVVFFANEFSHVFKKIWAIPGVKLLLPLCVLSWVVVVYEAWGYWLLQKGHGILDRVVHVLVLWLPFEAGALACIRIIFLFIIASVPLWIHRVRPTKNSLKETAVFSWGLVLWMVAVVLIVVPY